MSLMRITQHRHFRLLRASSGRGWMGFSLGALVVSAARMVAELALGGMLQGWVG